ncbi:MAG: PilZ domain-containing protein, partial [Acidithiobacillus sp.]|uniref:PilZ domain-containing protein n=1 Tax=Acidithiobacillus sp. TaxID=1872118 RepID=UPI003D01C753
LRSGLELAEYLQLLLPEFPESVAFSDSGICQAASADAVILSSDPEDAGHPYRFLGCDPDTQDLRMTPKRPNLIDEKHYRRALLFMEAQGRILMGLSAFKYRHQGTDCFSPPPLIYSRKTRQDRRVRIDGQILLRHRDGRTITARLHDFSPSGASFYTDEPFPVGESLLAEFEVLDCGACETVVTTAREERLPAGSPYRYLVGVKMQLTAAQRKTLPAPETPDP